MERRVFIVKEGGSHGMSAEKGDYDRFVGELLRILRIELPKPGTNGKESERLCEVAVVPSTEEALNELAGSYFRGVLVFVSKGMLWKAEQIKKAHRDLRVVVFSGTSPENEVLTISKAVLPFPALVEDAVLTW